MDRRRFLQLTSLAGLFSALPFSSRSGSNPNILFIIVDQMRRPVWFRENRLPHYNKLRSESVEFTNHFVCSVPCSPSRACLMTGTYPNQHRAWKSPEKDGVGLDPAIPTIGSFFQGIGYQTVYFGKWHLGDEAGRSDFEFKTEDFISGPRHGEDKIIVDSFHSWVEENADLGPWLAVVSLLNPHRICGHSDWANPPVRDIKRLPYNWLDFGKKPSLEIEWPGSSRFDTRDPNLALGYLNWYYYFNQRMDAHLGTIIAILKQLKIYRDTLVVFTSDHGEMGCSHGLARKPPVPYTEVLNVPLLIKLPGDKGYAVNSISENIDVFPTLTAMFGSIPDYLQGKNLLGRLPPNKYAYFEAMLESGKICYGQRDAKWSSFEYPNGKELYNLFKDPLMLNNLA